VISNRSEFLKLSREHANISELTDRIRARRKVADEEGGARAMLREGDPEMRELAKEEVARLEVERAAVEHRIKILLLPKDPNDDRNILLEIRAGTGGEEAALFAADLFRMYMRFAERRRWRVDIMSRSDSSAGGIKEVIALIEGNDVYSALKYESGVHRVQRVPATETQGRIHTSAATVAVLPEAEEIDVAIRAEDIRLDTTRASSAGGQHANTTDSGVRILHIPTGIIVTSVSRSQHQNRVQAMQMLRARLFDIERQKADDERAAARKVQVGSGDRSERIRTYNYPQGRVTDHRINLTLYKLDQVLSGEALDEVIEALITEHQASLLAAEVA
jgi:peptide chain release factor 1